MKDARKVLSFKCNLVRHCKNRTDILKQKATKTQAHKLTFEPHFLNYSLVSVHLPLNLRVAISRLVHAN